ncbi:fungal-specific transcription factor domain-containing protein [Ilyonectria robusta]|uniref:fungal-specific transcription factor domain-containing protein n=1 Tax=Ilyonectria robusta TaxID=1079257 RepID=UPI001E8EEC37|nr:fungal-specific transcription factor domain-containing protein [Ilyonectria robusta]KAH8683782.1 fungal-specific transcription factor domain-containing protein [Ilyonectria robusta]
MSIDTLKAKKACWTCKARKIQCDRTLPSCQKCARAQRECQGYGLRLSWPRDNDKKRAVTQASSAPSDSAFLHEWTKIRFINTTLQDIELHRHLSLQALREIQPPHLVHLPPKLWRQPQPGLKHMDLVHHFCSTAYRSLAAFNSTTMHIRDSLTRMALANDTISGRALFYALLAVSSLHRGGLHLEAVQFKVSALHGLSASMRGGVLSSAEAAQHVATCMLLGTYDILLPSEGSGEWLWYVRGAMDIIQGAGLEQQSDQSEIGHLLDWVYYHNALSRFAMHHWCHKSVDLEATDAIRLDTTNAQYLPLVKDRRAIRSSNPAHEILNLLSETCDTVLDPLKPESHDREYQNRLKALEEKVTNLSTTPAFGDTGDEPHIPIELYQMATLIYLVRASQSPREPPPVLEHLIERAFAVPVRAPSCDHFFPLFILACEARTDQQRALILELIDRTEKKVQVRSMKGLQAEIKSVWVQQDLYADGELLVNYFGLMNTVISSNRTLPSYA